MNWYEPEVRSIEKTRGDYPQERGAVAFYGSSSIRLWAGLADDFPGEQVLNLGFGGSTLAACVHFFERIVVPCQPRSLVLYAGDNDLGDGRSPRHVFDSFSRLSQKTTGHLGTIPLAFISIKPSPARWYLIDAIRETNAVIRQALASRENGCYIDVFNLMLGADGRPRREFFLDDGLHLSPAGYRLWAQAVSSHYKLIF